MAGPVLDKDLYDVLNAVALKKMASAAAVAEATGQAADAVAGALRELADRDLVVAVGDAALPTDDADPALVAAAAAHYERVRRDPVVLQVADRFEDVNARFLQALSAWQQVDTGGRCIPNDHTDAGYDDRIVTRIERLVGRLADLLDVLAERDPRFGGYRRRFDRALDRVTAGEIDFVSAPTLDSVHNVWFEFHEDLLRTLGRARKE